MQRIIEEFGTAVLAVIVAGATFAFVLGNGGISAIGERVKQEEGTSVFYKESEVLKEICGRERPSISYHSERVWNTGQRIPVAEAFRAVDADGAHLQTEVLAIEDSNGNSRMEWYLAQDHAIYPETAGIYWITLYASDSRQRSAEEKLALIVDDGGGNK